MGEEELKAACEDVFTNKIVVTQEEANYLEESTRLQSQSLLWFKHRTGRITASKFLAVKRASLTCLSCEADNGEKHDFASCASTPMGNYQ